MENTKTTRLYFKGRWILAYCWHSDWHNFGYVLEKVTKLHFLESPQKSLKTNQRSYQYGHPLRNNGPLEKWKICVFFCGSSKQKLLTFWIFNETNIWAKVYHIWKNWGIGVLYSKGRYFSITWFDIQILCTILYIEMNFRILY